MKRSPIRRSHVILAFALLGLVCLAVPVAITQADNQPQAGQCSGYYYTVKLGETWTSIARRVGQPAGALKSANPQAIRPRDLIYAGEKLCVPAQGGGVEQGGYWYQVKPGDTWNKLSRATGVPLQQLWAANPGLVNRQQWLYIGQRVWIPALPKGATPVTPTATTTASAAAHGDSNGRSACTARADPDSGHAGCDRAYGHGHRNAAAHRYAGARRA